MMRADIETNSQTLGRQRAQIGDLISIRSLPLALREPHGRERRRNVEATEMEDIGRIS